jgi:hypothetical protein
MPIIQVIYHRVRILLHEAHTHNQNMVKATNIWFAGYFSDLKISPNIGSLNHRKFSLTFSSKNWCN